jgi:hypothetical protein
MRTKIPMGHYLNESMKVGLKQCQKMTMVAPKEKQ